MIPKAPEQTNASSPQVSVIMPMLNARPFLESSIGSVLSQSFHDFELIIVDNGSEDGSKEYAESLSDKRIRVISEPRRGAAHATNAGIAATRADLLALMDADDVSSRDRLAIQVAYMRDHPETVLLGSRFTFLVGTKLVPVAAPLIHHQQIRKALLQGVPVLANGSTMFRAAAAKGVGGHSLNGPAHDFDFFVRMSEIGIIHNLRETLYQYRLHDGASTAVRTTFITEQIAFAVACATARDAGIPEPAFEDFHREWMARPLLTKVGDRAKDISAQLYRSAIIQRAQGRRVLPGLAMIGSALLNPQRAMLRIKRQLGARGDRRRAHSQAGLRPNESSLISG